MIEYFELVASQLGSDFIDEQLTTHCIAWLTDPVYSVREAAVANLRKLMEIFGVAWAERVIVPRVLYLRTASEMAGPAADVLARNYLLRITALRCMVVRAWYCGGSSCSPRPQGMHAANFVTAATNRCS